MDHNRRCQTSSTVNYQSTDSHSDPTCTVSLATPTHTAVIDLLAEAGRGGSSGHVLHWLNVEDIELLELPIVTQGGERGPPVHIAGHFNNSRGGKLRSQLLSIY